MIRKHYMWGISFKFVLSGIVFVVVAFSLGACHRAKVDKGLSLRIGEAHAIRSSWSQLEQIHGRLPRQQEFEEFSGFPFGAEVDGSGVEWSFVMLDLGDGAMIVAETKHEGKLIRVVRSEPKKYDVLVITQE